MSHILIVDDEESICWSLSRLLGEEGHAVTVAASAEQALSQGSEHGVDAIVLDVRLPGMDGLSAMERLEQSFGPVPIVIMTAFGSLSTAVDALRKGAFDYLPKPFDLDEAATVISRALARTEEASRHGRSTRHDARGSGEEIVGTSAAMQGLFKQIALVAPTSTPVLITGESGAGKELIARAIHRHSRRAAQPFVPVNVASLNPSLVESELFGHVRGAFTGATDTRKGQIELAHGGTLFIDEVGEIPLAVQVKLLRVLEEQEVTPVGDNRPRQSDFRVIAATNMGLRHLVGEKRFRDDLYFRLAVFEISVPALRDRPRDIPLLAEHFLRQIDGHYKTAGGGRRTLRFSPATLDELTRRAWPGNVRELRNSVEHAALRAREGVIGPEHLPPPIAFAREDGGQLAEAVRHWARSRLAQRPKPNGLYQEFLKEIEPPLLDAVLEATGENASAAAKMLGLHRATLRKKLT